jgi:hypothetical protein
LGADSGRRRRRQGDDPRSQLARRPPGKGLDQDQGEGRSPPVKRRASRLA